MPDRIAVTGIRGICDEPAAERMHGLRGCNHIGTEHSHAGRSGMRGPVAGCGNGAEFRRSCKNHDRAVGGCVVAAPTMGLRVGRSAVFVSARAPVTRDVLCGGALLLLGLPNIDGLQRPLRVSGRRAICRSARTAPILFASAPHRSVRLAWVGWGPAAPRQNVGTPSYGYPVTEVLNFGTGTRSDN